MTLDFNIMDSERQKLLEQIQQLTGASGSGMGLFERYTNSELKRIIDDMKTVKVGVDHSIINAILLVGILGLCLIYLYK